MIGACDIRDFSPLSPHLHCFWLMLSRLLEGGPGSSPHLTSGRHRERKGQGRGSSLYIHPCRDCSSTWAPLSVMLQPEAIIGRDPKIAIPHTHDCWKHFATVLICSDVVTERHSFVSCTVVGAGKARSGCQQGDILLRSGCTLLAAFLLCLRGWMAVKRGPWNPFYKGLFPSQTLHLQA